MKGARSLLNNAGTAGRAKIADPDDRPTWQEIRQKVGEIARGRKEWAGLPTPIEEAALVMAPKHPYFKDFNGVKLGDRKKPAERVDVVNSWHCRRTRCWIVIYREGGKVTFGLIGEGCGQRVTDLVHMVGILQTFDLEAEQRAQRTLGTLINKGLFQSYQMTGMFIETSKRSGVTYLFRRLATTIAFRAGEGNGILAALCLHPVGYYEALPIGVMVPTDDVIAHLVMMRADEHFFWKKANQHGPSSPGAML